MSVLGLAEARSVLLVILTLCLPPLYIVQSERLAEWRRETAREGMLQGEEDNMM